MADIADDAKLDANDTTDMDSYMNDSDNNASMPQAPIFYMQYWMGGVLTNLVVVLGLVGNLLTIVILSQRAMRSSTNYYLTALAVWDSVVLICTFFLIGLMGVNVEVYVQYFYSYVVAYIYPVALIAQTATIWLTVSFTVERYIAVCHPLKAASMCTITRAKIVIIAVSLGSSLYNIPRWFEYRPVYQVHPESNKTLLTHEMTEFSQNPLYLTGYFSCLYVPIMFIIPFLGLFILNTFLIRAVRQSQRNREMHMNVRQSRENNVTIMLVSVVIVFMICQLPALVYNLAFSIDISMVENSYGYNILSQLRNFMVNLNSAINFILYCALGQKFRRIFLHTFCWRCTHEKYAPMSGTHHHTTLVSIPSHRSQRFSSGKDDKFSCRKGDHDKPMKGAFGVEPITRAGDATVNCKYHPVTQGNSGAVVDKWQRTPGKSELVNGEQERTYTIDQVIPECNHGNHTNKNTYPMYKLHMNNGSRVPP